MGQSVRARQGDPPVPAMTPVLCFLMAPVLLVSASDPGLETGFQLPDSKEQRLMGQTFDNLRTEYTGEARSQNFTTIIPDLLASGISPLTVFNYVFGAFLLGPIAIIGARQGRFLGVLEGLLSLFGLQFVGGGRASTTPASSRGQWMEDTVSLLARAYTDYYNYKEEQLQQ